MVWQQRRGIAVALLHNDKACRRAASWHTCVAAHGYCVLAKKETSFRTLHRQATKGTAARLA